MKKIFKKTIVISAIIFVSFLTSRYIQDIENNKLKESTEINYTEMVKLVKNNENIKSITLENNQKAIIQIKGEEQTFFCKIINEDLFLELLQSEILKGKDFKIIAKTEASFIDYFFVIFLAVFIILILKILLTMVRSNGSSISTPIEYVSNLEKNSEQGYIEKIAKTNITFDDVAALDEEKEELKEIVDFIKKPEKYTKLGAKIPKGILLSGSPGTGKTLLAKAVAGETDVTFVALSGSEFIEKYVGVGASRIRALFKEARKNSPCIIFIDEIDAIGHKRTGSSEYNSEYHQTLEQLLTELDGFNVSENIIVFAATNRPEILDPALTRAGRFDRKIIVNLPDIKGREEILRIHGRNKPFYEDVDFHKIASNTAGLSGAELENLLNEAALIAARKESNSISADNINEALKKIQIGLQKNKRVISENEKKLVAYHEAGHAVVSKFLKTQNKIEEISIIPRGNAGGYTLHKLDEEQNYVTKTELLEEICVLLGGRVAERIVLGDISSGASNDIEVATDLAKQYTMIYGMDDEIGPVKLISVDGKSNFIGSKITDSAAYIISNLIKNAEENAKVILTEHINLLHLIAQKLIEIETISGDEFYKFVNECKND